MAQLAYKTTQMLHKNKAWHKYLTNWLREYFCSRVEKRQKADLKCFDGVPLVQQFEVFLLQKQKLHLDDLFRVFQVNAEILQN